jgi:hypothetical protein
MEKGAVPAYFEVLSCHSPEGLWKSMKQLTRVSVVYAVFLFLIQNKNFNFPDSKNALDVC